MHIPTATAAILVAACTLLRTTSAVLVDEAWNVDYHLALLGAPQEHTTSFHQPFAGSKASLLYTLSEQAVLGAVNPKDGSVVWRQQLNDRLNGTNSFLRAGEDQDIVISGIDGEVGAWSASDGRQAWLHNLEGGSIKDLEIIEIQDSKQERRSKDAIVLSGGSQTTLSRLDGQDGHVKWSFKDESGDEPYQVSASATDVFAIFLHSTMLGGLKIKVVSLDPTNGRKIDQYMLSTEGDLASSADIISVGANTASPIIAWSDKAHTTLKVNVIGNKAVATFPVDSSKPVERIALHAPYSNNARPHFLVHYQTAQDHWAEVYHVDLKHSAVTKAYSLPKLAGYGAFSTSLSDANVYFTRISESEVSVVSSVSHGVLARWPLKISSWGASQGDRKPIHAVSEVSVKSDTVSAVRVAVYLESGDWVLIRDGAVIWYRPEALSQTVSAVWAYSAIGSNLVHELEIEEHSNPLQAYIHRISRHVDDLKHLPAYLNALPARLLHSIGIGSSAPESTLQDNFGFHKTIVCATANGRLIALDAGSSGKTLWDRPLPELKSGQAPQLFALPDGTILIQSAEGKILHKFDASTGSEVDFDSNILPDSVVLAQSSYTYSLENGKLKGGPASGESAWQFVPTGDQRIVSVTPRPFDDPVASIGKVLGDRRVLYKYLNPNIVVVTAISEVAKVVSISIVDTVSGAVIYTVTHEDVDVTLPIASTISENWFAYSFTSATAQSGTKGHQLVVNEMYESEFANDRGPRGSALNASAITSSYEPHVITQTYQISEKISHFGVTQTRQGITSRLLLAVLPESGAVVGIPRAVIDPRRPVGRDPTAAEQMEGLVRYDPVLRFDPKWYLTHQREVLGVEKLTTSPAILESTSLIFAYGLDIFGTRSSPSFSFDVLGKDFNKLQMLATVAALAIATLVVAPLVCFMIKLLLFHMLTTMQVKRKQINARWQFT